MSNDNPVKLAENKFRAEGIAIPLEVQAAADRAYAVRIAKERERHELAEQRKGKFQRFVEGYIERYPMLQDGVTKLGNWSMAVIKLFAVNGLVSLILIFTLIAEWSRVATGLGVIEASPLVVYMLSGVMVFSVVAGGFLRYFVETEANHVEPDNFHWSLRLTLQNWRYQLGIGGDQWQARKMSPAKNIILTQRIVKAGVVITALYGSMAHVVGGYKGNWLEALGAIITTSSLRDFAGWVIGIMITVAILAISDMTSNHVASRAMSLEKSVFAKGDDKLELQGLEASAGVLWTYYNSLRKAQRTGAILQPSTQPAAMPRHTQGGVIRLPLPTDASTDAPMQDSEPMQTDATLPLDASVADAMQTDAPMQQGKPIDIARAWLRSHPNHGMVYRAAAKVAGVSESAMQRAMKNPNK